MRLTQFKHAIASGVEYAVKRPTRLPRVRLNYLRQAIGMKIAARRLSARNRQRIERSGLFDAAWYLRQAPGAVQSGLDPLEHYFYVGWKKGLSPGPYFDASWYRTYYNDVDVAGWEPLLHFIRHGIQRGRCARGVQGSIYDAFQSLGTDCEFGSVQRHFGSNSLALFRFAGTHADGLLAAFDQGLDQLIAKERVQVFNEKHEYCTRVLPFELLFHTHVFTPNSTAEEIKAHEVRRLQLLVRKFVEDLEDGGKIFLYKAGQLSLTKMEDLAQRLGHYGPNRLLCVTLTPDARKIGAVELLSERLALGYIDRFDVDMTRSSLNVWSAICHKALSIWHAEPIMSA
jgi:hypothetical protein